ncbi:MAG: electron transport complex subunit RsxC, partial [Oligoflexia bacterium]|nr:electron transport complex subunit RsxC [Oligoflexia bacterium]
MSASLDGGARSGPGTFHHGVHPDGAKEHTQHLTIERMPFVERYVIPLAQHIGAPAVSVVQAGQHVKRGQLIARAGGFISTCHHAPVTGKVLAIDKERYPNGSLVDAIVIQADRFDPQQLAAPPADDAGVDWRSATDKEFMAVVQGGGIVGLGGAAFPSHVKLAVPQGRVCKQLVINGCECEPYLTCDHRTMVEQPDLVLRGIDIAGTRLKAQGAVIGVELNKPDGITALNAAIARRQARIQAGTNDGISFPVVVRGVKVKYPQGAEKMLIKALFNREVAAGKLPLDLGYVVNNVATMVALAQLIDDAQPLIERVLTVSGDAVSRPANLLVPVGTSLRAVLEYCGGISSSTRSVVMGGPMMGMPVATLDAPVLKGTSGLLAFRHSRDPLAAAGPCIKCGQCLHACPYMLNPSRLGRMARAGKILQMEDWLVLDC